MNETAVLDKVRQVLSQALDRDLADIQPEHSLVMDLGAESIDFLDINFRLERELNLKLGEGKLFPSSLLGEDPRYVQGSRVTEAGIARLRELVPLASFDRFLEDPRVDRVTVLFTVGMLARQLHQLLQAETT
jgi:acyl carrier protein